MARAAERAKIHFIFLADGQAVRVQAKDNEALSYSGRVDLFEPLTLIAALSAVTEHIGFVATASTTYNEPYTIARKYASLDYISGGRVGWNVVTSWSEAEAKNFSREKHLDHDVRYRRAQEFFDIVTGLWDSWEDDAFIRDKAGRYFHPEKLHVLNHRGEFFQVRGPLNVPRPPQGYPVIAQAGSSEPGQELGARTADLIYTAQRDLAEAQAFYASVKGKMPKYGRKPEDALVMPGALVVTGDTRAEAEDRMARLESVIPPEVGYAILNNIVGDLSAYPVDGPVPESMSNGPVKSIANPVLQEARKDGLTIRQFYTKLAGAAGHQHIVGAPADIADHFEEWFTRGACDGFNLMIPYYPEGLTLVLDKVVPELQRRGLFRTEYEGRTLRENLGLPRPNYGSAVKRDAIHSPAVMAGE
ncbi:Nitrilotriacetate monooxygenase component A [Hyphomicrobiales bacterium]|nr:Nitrilotriacetate monooxygenase component A [Hyphomicrobiales bacterium]CAH1691363.1 Nitrilotriacetate monooxygenase component A [Hyphomicrobiales bacterium]